MKALDPGSNDRDQQVFQWDMGMARGNSTRNLFVQGSGITEGQHCLTCWRGGLSLQPKNWLISSRGIHWVCPSFFICIENVMD